MSGDTVRVVCDRGEWHIKSRRNGHLGRRPWVLATFVQDGKGDIDEMRGWHPITPSPHGAENPGQQLKREMVGAGTLFHSYDPSEPITDVTILPCQCGWPAPDILECEHLVDLLDRAAQETHEINLNEIARGFEGQFVFHSELPTTSWDKAATLPQGTSIENSSLYSTLEIGGYGLDDLSIRSFIVMCDTPTTWHKKRGARPVLHMDMYEEEAGEWHNSGEAILGVVTARNTEEGKAIFLPCECGRTITTPQPVDMEVVTLAAELLYNAGYAVVSVEEFADTLQRIIVGM